MIQSIATLLRFSTSTEAEGFGSILARNKGEGGRGKHAQATSVGVVGAFYYRYPDLRNTSESECHRKVTFVTLAKRISDQYIRSPHEMNRRASLNRAAI